MPIIAPTQPERVFDDQATHKKNKNSFMKIQRVTSMMNFFSKKL